MGQLIPFEGTALPAHLADFAVSGDDLTSGAGGGFPSISIKGKVFHIVRGDERTLITDPNSADDEPARSIEVVILRANPGLSKNYYTEAYVEGSDAKPTCYSQDGIAPAADAQEPQATKCAVCPHNVWGSKISEQGSKGKACSDSRRLAVAPAGQLNDPMLIRVPAASLKTLYQYGELLKKRGVKYPAVVTRIGFDYTVAHPALTFKPVGFLDAELMKEVAEQIKSDVVTQIVGVPLGAKPAAPAPAIEPPKAEPAPVKAEPAKPAAKKAANAFNVAAAADQKADKPEVKVETKATKTAAKSTTIEVKDAELEAELGNVLSQAGFDD